MNPESSPPRYWAFISYSSKDAAVAARLHRALESYRLPRDLVGRPGLDGTPVPKALFPVFRDRDELPLSSDLGATIEDALRASRYLIVICSPDAAQSRWVNEEIRHFKALGREQRILAIIVRGEPNSSHSPERVMEECFPPALRRRVDAQGQLTAERVEPIGGDLRPGGDGWTACLLKVVAGMTGLGFNAFVKREQKRRQRRRLLTGGLAALLLAAGLGWWDYTRTKVSYFGELTERFGVPEGAIPLGVGTVRHREVSYRVESSRGKVRRVLRVNSAGSLRDDKQNQESSIQETTFREDGSIESLTLWDHNGRVRMNRVFGPATDVPEGRVVFVQFKDQYHGAALAQGGFAGSFDRNLANANDSRTEITVHRVVYSADGLPVQRSFHNNLGVLRSGGDGVFGQRFRYDARRMPVEVINLGFDLRPAVNREGIVSRRSERDAEGWVTNVFFLNAEGRRILHPSGFAGATFRWDEHGNPTERSYFGLNSQPVLQRGYARMTVQYNERGNLTSVAYFGMNGEPVLQKDGYAREASRYDERGYETTAAYFGVNGQPVLHKDGYAQVTWQYDARGNVTEESYFGVNGQPVLSRDGYARVTLQYDPSGSAREAAYFGVDGQPVLRKDGYARFTVQYDERGRVTGKSYFGVEGQPVLHKDGYARFTVQYDERGNLMEQAYFGLNNEPVVQEDGYARVTIQYDERGNVTNRAYFGVNGRPTLHQQGNARATRRYDAMGNATEEAYFGLDNQPVLHVGGYARFTTQYDEKGNGTNRAFFGVDGGPLLLEDGYARICRKYDAMGNVTEEAYFGLHNEPVLHKNGYSRVTAQYDERGNLTEKAYFGVDNQPVVHEDGPAGFTMQYDERGNVTELAYFGVNKQPVLFRDGYARATTKYDERGNATEVAYFGVRGQPVLHVGGFARFIQKHDARGSVTEEAYFGTNSEPIEVGGAARVVAEFDQTTGLLLRRLLYDARGNEVHPASRP